MTLNPKKVQENVIEMAKGAATKEMIEHIAHCQVCGRVLTDSRKFVDWHIEEMTKQV